MRGREGPVRSRSRSPTRVVGDVARSERASWTAEEDLPTPPEERVRGRKKLLSYYFRDQGGCAQTNPCR